MEKEKRKYALYATAPQGDAFRERSEACQVESCRSRTFSEEEIDRVLGYTGGGQCFLPPGSCIPMSTAIARIYTPEGFVIAADGRSANERKHVVLDDSMQKIFSLEHPGSQLAYTIAGLIGLSDLEGIATFDFISETARAVSELRDDRPRSLRLFAEAIMNRLYPLIARAKEPRNVFPDDFPAWESQTVIFVDGYYDGRPESARIKFRHLGVGQRETIEDTSSEPLAGGYEYGSARIIGMLLTEDEALAAFRPSRKREGMTMQEAIQVARNWIRAHCAPIAVDLDPDCWAMGGDMHMATVTPAYGFQWVKPPGLA